MPRNSGGTYSLPAGNPVVTATTISSVWANTTLSDIGTALTGSLARNGDGGMTGVLKLSDGAVGAPGLTWGTETTSGLYRAAAGDFRYSVASVDKFQITTNGIRTVNGTAPLPSISFIGDPDTGFYSIVGNNVGASANGVYKWGWDASVFNTRIVVQGPNGTAGAPTYSFENDPNTGFYSSGLADTISVAVNGTEIGRYTGSGTGELRMSDGTVAFAAFAFLNDPDCGLYRIGANDWGLSAGGALIVELTTGGIAVNGRILSTPTTFEAMRIVRNDATITYYEATNTTRTGYLQLSTTGGILNMEINQPLEIRTNNTPRISIAAGGTTTFSVTCLFPDGLVTAGNVPISFSNDTDTGFYRTTADQIAIALGGVTAGQIAQGSFVATLTGFTAAPTPTFTWQRIGNKVIIRVPQFNSTSNGVGFTCTNIPAIIQPSTPTWAFIQIGVDNGGTVTNVGCAISGATMTFFQGSSAGWTAANAKGLGAVGVAGSITITYQV